MAEVEWDREQDFRRKAREHWLSRWVPLWTPPPPRESLGSRFHDSGDSAIRKAA